MLSSHSYKSSIYTKTGDFGFSSLYNGERRAKTDFIFKVLGSVDELNALIGLTIEYCKIEKNDLQDFLYQIQNHLFDLGSSIATPTPTPTPISINNLDKNTKNNNKKISFPQKNIEFLEKNIDLLDNLLNPLTNFILPGGTIAASYLHFARTVCRRAERQAFMLKIELEPSICIYLNRLSDFLFVAARFATHHMGTNEIIYKKAE